MTTTREAIEDTITRLRTLIEQAVRNEQLRHQLTGLPNASALDERLLGAIEDGKAFWLAFIEIDQFKRINDRYGYDRADGLLREVAKTLDQAAPRYFAGEAMAFHAHGDEFYLLGWSNPTRFDVGEIDRRLNAIRESIAHIALSADEIEALMRCTVSIGWVENSDGRARDYLRRVEAAVGHAKRRGRNQVIKYDGNMSKLASISSRSDCARCHTVFSFDVPVDAMVAGDIFCPNCGERGGRPEHAAAPSGPKDITGA